MELCKVEFWSTAFDTHALIRYGGILFLLGIVYVETGFFLGFVLPGGDYLLFAAGMFCGTDYLDTPIGLLVPLLIAAAFLGDLTGYHKGKWLGDKLFVSNQSRFFKPEYLTRANQFYHRFGMWAFVLGRFMPVIRTLVPMIAGATRYRYKRFLFNNLLGSSVWVGVLVPLGYFVGKTYPEAIHYSGYIVLFFFLVASLPVIKMFFSRK